MKRLLFYVLFAAIAASPIYSQQNRKAILKTKKATPAREIMTQGKSIPCPAAPNAKLIAENSLAAFEGSTTAPVGFWAIKSISIPAGLSDADCTITPGELLGNKYKAYRRVWKPSPGAPSSTLEVSLNITNYVGRVKDVRPDYAPENANPEYMISQALFHEVKAIGQSWSSIVESKPLKIDNFDGAYSLHKHPTDPERFSVEWITYRYYNANLQIITVKINGAKAELEKALKTAQSLKIEPVPQ